MIHDENNSSKENGDTDSRGRRRRIVTIYFSICVADIVARKTLRLKALLHKIKTTAFLTKHFCTRKISLAVTQ